MIKKYFFITLFILLKTAYADFTFIVPQKPGGGTSIWATVVALELEKKLGEKIIIRHFPGARDKSGFEKFHKELRFDPKIIMVSHGGNAISFIQEKVSYNYADYSAIAMMHNNIIVSKNKLLDLNKNKLVFSLHSGVVPEAMALAMLIDGNKAWKNWSKKAIPVKGMSQAENRLAFRRGEVNVTRENPAAHQKHVAGIKSAEIFFHHGLYNVKTSNFDIDPNYPNALTFEQLYIKKWKQAPTGKLYQAYRMIKAWRDGVQKALWVNKGNPHLKRLIAAVQRMLKDPVAVSRLQKRLGKYPWEIGKDASNYVESLYKLITKDSLETLVDFNQKALGLASYLNTDRLKNN